jgi:hypothetical protein
MKMRQIVLVGCLVLAGLCLAPSIGRAALQLDVTVDTSQISANYTGPYALDFTLIDGSGGGDFNNTATVSNFNFGTGGSEGPASPILTGGASGSLAGTVTLTESAFLNDFNQQFVPGSQLTFLVDLTTNPNTPSPDNFSFAILTGYDTSTGFPTGVVPTGDPSGADNLLSVDIVGGPGQSFSTFDSTDGFVTISAVQPSTVPEPSALIVLVELVCCGCGFALWQRRRGNRAEPQET